MCCPLQGWWHRYVSKRDRVFGIPTLGKEPLSEFLAGIPTTVLLHEGVATVGPLFQAFICRATSQGFCLAAPLCWTCSLTLPCRSLWWRCCLNNITHPVAACYTFSIASSDMVHNSHRKCSSHLSISHAIRHTNTQLFLGHPHITTGRITLSLAFGVFMERMMWQHCLWWCTPLRVYTFQKSTVIQFF